MTHRVNKGDIRTICWIRRVGLAAAKTQFLAFSNPIPSRSDGGAGAPNYCEPMGYNQ